MSERAPDGRQRWRAWCMDEIASGSGAIDAAGAVGDARARKEPLVLPREERDLLAGIRESARAEGYAAGFTEGREAGYGDGLAQGHVDGEHAFDERRRQLLEPLAPLAEGLRDALDQLDGEIADALVDVALAVGHKLAGDALDAHPGQVRTLIAELLRAEPLFSGQAQLRLHPDDAALVEAALAGKLEAAGWKLKPDAAVARGGCRLTGPEGELNATRETRWLALLARVRRHGSTPIHNPAPDSAGPVQ